MAFLKKPSSAVMFVVLMLLVTQLVESKPIKLIKPDLLCKLRCFKRCIHGIFKRDYFAPCMGACYFMSKCMGPKPRSHPSFQCGVGCITAKCSKPGDGNGKVSEECLTSCVNDCEEKFVNDVY